MKKKKSLKLLIALIFISFALLTIIISSVMTYFSETDNYHRECEKSLRQMTTHLTSLIKKDGMEFIYLEDYFRENNDKLEIPENYVNDIAVSKKDFYDYISEAFPGKQYGESLTFNELDDEGKRLYAKYRFEYWFSVFMESAESFDLQYVYYVYPSDAVAHKVVYMFDPSLATVTGSDGSAILSLADEVYEDPVEHEFLWKAWNTGYAPSGFDKINNEFGYVYTYNTPLIINGEKLGVICADISVDRVNSTILKSALQSLLILSLVLVVGTLFVVFFVDKQVVERIVSLEKSIKHYSENKDPELARDIIKVTGRADEIGSLCHEFSDMITELEVYMQNLQSVTAEKERIGAELDVATHIQASMLPRIFPPFPERDDIDLYATMNPAKEVGGDFYDFFLIDDTHLAVVMADVSGKGVPAALIMVIAKTLIKNHLIAGEELDKALMSSNMQLLENNDEMLFVTAWVGIIDLETGHIVFADAGHEPAFVLKKNGEVVEIKHKKKRPPLATIEGMKYVVDEFDIEKGDLLYLYTDGVPEAINIAEELFTKDRLVEVLKQHTSDVPKDLLKAVQDAMDEYVGEASQFDDITMLGVRINETSHE
ncbi:MAG: PP2C family protein-serine/threonine phosphatase [Lachnospiraceae bacterium]|nr:PP2C family protein-serine/threonine phosphatase [Lachnospiraceae bacterium]